MVLVEKERIGCPVSRVDQRGKTAAQTRDFCRAIINAMEFGAALDRDRSVECRECSA